MNFTLPLTGHPIPHYLIYFAFIFCLSSSEVYWNFRHSQTRWREEKEVKQSRAGKEKWGQVRGEGNISKCKDTEGKRKFIMYREVNTKHPFAIITICSAFTVRVVQWAAIRWASFPNEKDNCIHCTMAAVIRATKISFSDIHHLNALSLFILLARSKGLDIKSCISGMGATCTVLKVHFVSVAGKLSIIIQRNTH